MGDFNRYFDQIEADRALKEKTKQTVLKKLAEIDAAKKAGSCGDEQADEPAAPDKGMSRPSFMTRRILVPASAIAATFAVLFAGYVFYRIPVSYVSMDINPGIEMTLNVFGRVIRVEASNEDGEGILSGAHVSNLKADKAIRQLVQRAIDQGYVDDNGSTVISILAQSDIQVKALQIKEQITQGIMETLDQNEVFASIYADISDLEFRETVGEAGMSAGKYRLIRMLQAMDPEITMEQYRNAKISEIIQKADELAEDTNNLEDLDETTRAMVGKAQDAAEDVTANQIRAARQKQEQEQNQSQNQSGGSQASGSQGQQSNAVSQQASDPNQGTSTGTSHQGGDSGGASGSGMSQTSGGGSGQGGSGDDPYSVASQSGDGSGQGSSSGISQTSGGSGQGSSSGISQNSGGSGQGSSSGISWSGGGSGQGGSSGMSQTGGNTSQSGSSGGYPKG